MAIVSTCSNNEDEFPVAEEIHAEIRDALNIRRVNPDATPGDQIDVSVHEEPESTCSLVFCMLIVFAIFLPLLINGYHINQTQPYDQMDHATFIQEEIPTPCAFEFLTTSSQAFSSDQDHYDAKENMPVAEDVNLSIDAEVHDSSDADKKVTTNANVTSASDIDIRLAQPDLSSQEDLSVATSQPLAATDSHVTATTDEQGEIQQISNQSHFEDATRLDNITTEDPESVNGTDHDVNPPPDLAAVSNSSVKDAVTIAIVAGGEVNTRREMMNKEIEFQDNSDADSSEMASASGMDKDQCSHTMATRDEKKQTEDHQDIDRSLPTDLGIRDAPALQYSQEKE